MPGFPAPFIKFREDDNNGFPLAGGKLWSFAAGTSSPLPTYTTQALDIPNTNPVILDASGRASVFIPDGVGYRFTLAAPNDSIVWSQDNVQVPQIAAAQTPAVAPPGAIVMFGGQVAPPGWLLCDGRSYGINEHQHLFDAIGIAFGSGPGTFQVPDFRQRFPLGKAVDGTGVELGTTGGAIDHRHLAPAHTHPILAHVHQLPQHQHTVTRVWSPGVTGGVIDAGTVPNHVSTVAPGATGGAHVPAGDQQTTPGPALGTETLQNTTAGRVTESGGAQETDAKNPPFLVVNFIIKT